MQDRADRSTAAVSRRRAMALAAGAVLLPAVVPLRQAAASAQPAMPVLPDRPIRFDVIRLGEVIGFHNVDFNGSGDRFTVLTEIDIRVSLAGLTLFDFQNRCRERWQNGRLVEIESRTHEDDSDFVLTGKAVDDGFAVSGRKNTLVAPADIMAATYWSPVQFTRKQVIETKRGRLRDQAVLSRARVPLSIGGRSVEVDRLTVTGSIDGQIFYDDSDRWVGAVFARRASDITYRLKA
jgi:hypothetical protein